MDYKNIYEEWISNEYYDQETREELLEIKGNEAEIKDRFYKELEFGTGGLRGIIGAGTNRMNKYTVIKVTQGFANYLKSKANFDSNKGVAISYDNRNKSYEFAIYSSLVLNGNGIKTYVFKNLRPTPMLSFAVRSKNCIGGIMITASHNPREYNGYKVYGEDGAQLVSPKDEELISYVSKVKDFSEIKILTEEEAINKGFLNFIDQEMDNEYIEKVISRVVNKDINKDIKIVYTPLHGTGTVPVELALKKAGYKEFNIVEEQKVADSNFTTAPYPNPENKSVFSSGLKIAKKIDADVVLATDPDADRVGVYVKHKDDYVYFTGNMIGSILIEYILKLREEQGKDNSKGYIISTIVSTNMAKKIVHSYGANYLNVLTGFKYIAEKIKSFEQTDNEFLFGFEESIGYLSTDLVRDKDAISTAVLICEVISYYKSQKKTLVDIINEMYQKYGYFLEDTQSITLKGVEGVEKMKKIMKAIRELDKEEFSGLKTEEIRDYREGKGKKIKESTVYDLTLPKSDVVYFKLENDNWFCVRPSGTEAKIKIYFGTNGTSLEESENNLKKLKNEIIRIIENV